MSDKIYDLESFAKLSLENKTIGVLGGSFNPPHEGHLLIAKRALEEGLDYVILMIAEQNPLKPQYKNGFNDRTNKTRELSKKEDRIIVSTLESDLKSPNTYYTLEYLAKHFFKNNFTWIMGVD
ncbi:MAG: nicotinate (nicotinamide) nucleotide adenylyltransferase, partial [Pseudomonadota bacterium]